MKIFVVLLLLFINVLAEIELIVKSSEMEDSMEEFAFGEALILHSSNKDLGVVAENLMQAMTNRYHGQWITLVGTSLSFKGLKFVKNTTLLLEYKGDNKNNDLLLAQQFLDRTPDQSTWIKIIERARTSGVNILIATNSATLTVISGLAKEVLLKDFGDCDGYNDYTKWCSTRISIELQTLIESKSIFKQGEVTVTVGENKRCYSQPNKLGAAELYIFEIGDIYFEVMASMTSLESTFERAKVAKVQQISTSNPVNFNRFSQLAKNVISRDYKSCDKKTESIDISNWCYKLMSESMVDSINDLFNGTSTSAYSATVGNNNRCFSETLGLNITEAHVFNLADIYFEITGFKI